jgi:hypothetical protein
MPIPAKYLADFTENGIYHIYNRTNNNELLFHSDENRLFFLQRYDNYLSHLLDTYCWCLLPNHFHFLSKIKSEMEIRKGLESFRPRELTVTENRFLQHEKDLGDLIEQSFKRFFQSYSISFNNYYSRKGNLFYKPYKRLVVESEEHFTQSAIYIHTNPVKHNISRDFTRYKWSSWKTLLSDHPTNLLRDELISRFGGMDSFIRTHVDSCNLLMKRDIAIEE